MFKKTRLFVTLSLLTILTVTGFSYAFFSFDLETAWKDKIQDLRYDSIFENYRTIASEFNINKLSDKKFDVYIFPSSEYFDIYKKYLETPKDKRTDAMLPENLAGHISPSFKDDGTLVLDNHKKPIYKVYRDQAKNQQVDESYNFTYTKPGEYSKSHLSYPADGYVKHMDKLTKENVNIGGSIGTFIDKNTIVGDTYKEVRDLNGYSINKMDTSSGYNKRLYDIYEYYISKTSNKRPYGSPTDKPLDWNTEQSKGKQLFGEWGKGADSNKALFPMDRFGCWNEFTMEEGRYLPIKLDVINSISPQVLLQCIPSISSTMNDGGHDPWFDLDFSCFTYVNFKLTQDELKSLHSFDQNRDYSLPYFDNAINNSGHSRNFLPSAVYNDSMYNPKIEKNEVLARDFFQSFDLNNVFSFERSLSLFSDENNVVRLFPTFASGKGYWSQRVKDAKSGTTTKYEVDPRIYGGSDAVKFEINQYDPLRTHYSQILEGKESDEFAANSKTISPAYLSEIAKIEVQNKNIEVSATKLANIPINLHDKKTRIRIRVAPAFGASHWYSGWFYTYDIDFGNLPKYITKEIESGTYNLYLFIGNAGKDKIGTYVDNNWKGVPNNETHFNYLFDNGCEELRNVFHKEFNGKKLISIPFYANPNDISGNKKNFIDYEGSKNTDGKLNQDIYDGAGNFAGSKNNRPIYLAIQKAPEPKIYNDIDPKTQSREEIQKQVEDNYLVTPAAYDLERPAYYYEKDGDTLSRCFIESGTSNNIVPNSYIFNAVDFTDVDNMYFQFRFGTKENKEIRFAKKTDQGTLFGAPVRVFVNIKNDALDMTIKGEELRKYLDKNAVDFYRMDATYQDTGKTFLELLNVDEHPENGATYVHLKNDEAKGIYDIILVYEGVHSGHPTFIPYIHRHTNIFIKILDRKPQATDYYTPPTDNDLNIHFVNHNAMNTLWQKNYYIGDIIKKSDKSDTKENRYSLEYVLQEYMKSHPGVTKDNLLVRDYVTDAPILYYKKIGTKYELVSASNFKVLKNYLWYIDTLK